MSSSRTQTLRNLILDICSSKTTGVKGLTLWNKIRLSENGYSIDEFELALSYMRINQWIVCVNKLWWLTDYAKQNWQKAKDAT